MTAKWHNTRYVGQAARKLGWVDSPGFFDAGRFNELPHNALRYACRKAADTSALQGVYLLNDKEGRNHIPVAFLCQADTEQEAREIHRRVWNINLVPFVVVESPTRIRVFQGFKYDARQQTEHAFAAASLTDKVELLDRLAAFRAESIDDGRVFETWGHLVTPTTRVDEHLLGQLQRLDGLLRQLSLSRDASHCLIGKYVWLSYLRARGILSDWRLQKYGIREEDIFSRNAKLTAFHHLDQQLQGWLNGEIFPLRGEDRRAVKSEHLQKVAGVFAGDDADGQLCLFNEFYDFSHLPIETLSVVYEQFLHHKEEGDERSEGEESGAYYTPVCLADFMIAELDRKIPLQDGVAVFDPSCGSGAFLVQAYRRLVERTMHDRGRDLRLKELKDLLEDNIFGVDRDPDACKVARMSLAIALLGYANPPDVSGPVANFKLPTLSENNIRQKDFFELDPSWPRAKDKKPPQWIIGNPPWVELKTAKRPKDKRNQPAWDWLDKNAAKQKASMPVSGNQVAEMFVWRVLDFARDDSVIGLVMPAMTLFKHEAKKFRQAFFGRTGVWCVANFANFMEVLFAGRARQPAACFFYEPSLPDDTTKQKPIATLTPLITDQYSNLSHQPGKQVDTWNIVIRPQDYREVDRHEASKGDRLTWKLAMWASEREKRLMKKIGRFQSFEAWRTEAGIWEPALGPQLRNGPGKDLDLQSELIGKRRLSYDGLRNAKYLTHLPPSCISDPLPESKCYVPSRASKKGVQITRSPQLFFEATRPFAIFSDTAMVPPAQRICIHGPDAKLLKALSMYLTSRVACWHQFLTSSQWGVATSTSTLDDLNKLPIPFGSDESPETQILAELYSRLNQASEAILSSIDDPIQQAYDVCAKMLALSSSDRDLIDGFFAGPFQCIQGKVPNSALENSRSEDITRYCLSLRRELDDYTSLSGYKHRITVTLEARHVMLTIGGTNSKEPFVPAIHDASREQSEQISRIASRLRQKHSQWMYFEKALYIYEKGQIHYIKPRRRIEWNVRQAVLDAEEIIAESLTSRETA